MPLVYAIALKDCGIQEVHDWVGCEPTAEKPDTFSVKMPGGGGHGGVFAVCARVCLQFVLLRVLNSVVIYFI